MIAVHPGTQPARTYNASTILRTAALVAGQYVTCLLGQDDTVASDGDAVFVVTDASDKRGNPLLVQRDNGAVVAASPASVWALW